MPQKANESSTNSNHILALVNMSVILHYILTNTPTSGKLLPEFFSLSCYVNHPTISSA